MADIYKTDITGDGDNEDIDHPVVLLVSDNPLFINLINRMLAGDEGIELIVCEEPWLAMSEANDTQPTVIFLDMDLETPDIDSLDLLATCRNNPDTAVTPIIALAESLESVDKRIALECGASDYLVKIPDEIELIARVHAYTRTHLAQLKRTREYLELKERLKRLRPAGL